MTQKVLITYGDGYGPAVIRAAETVLRTVSPGTEIIHGKIGADAYENTGYALPAETMEAVAECDAMISGPVVMDGIAERNPISTIKKQMELYMEYGEFYSLCDYIGTKGIDTILLSPTIESSLNVFETESLDGVASEYYTSTDNISKIFAKSVQIAEKKRRTEICMVSDNVLYPSREKLIRSTFHKFYADTEFEVRDISTKIAMFDLAHDPSSMNTIISDIHSATCMWGEVTGLVGGSGLMPKAFIGDRKALYMPSEVYPHDAVGRELNPTSAILSVGVMMLNFGNETAYNLVLGAIRDMYRMGRTTPDVGGKLNAEKFAEGVSSLILSEINSD